MRLGQWTSLTLQKIDPTSHYIHKKFWLTEYQVIRNKSL